MSRGNVHNIDRRWKGYSYCRGSKRIRELREKFIANEIARALKLRMAYTEEKSPDKE